MERADTEWFVRSSEGKVYGPTDRKTLIEWAKEGRIEPSGFVSSDRKTWIPAQLMGELEMKWVVEAEPGKFYGPFNRNVVSRLASGNGAPPGAVFYRKHEFAIDQDPPPVTVEKKVEVEVEKIVEKEVRVEVPVEKIVEKIVEKEVIIEVEPPARRPIVGEAAAPAFSERPPVPQLGGMFKNVNPAKLAELEAAAQRELAAAKNAKGGGFAGLFPRRRS